MIDENVLLDYGAKKVTYSKGDQLFREGELALNFYQISSGEIKMNNYNEDGKEFIQGIFSLDRVLESLHYLQTYDIPPMQKQSLMPKFFSFQKRHF